MESRGRSLSAKAVHAIEILSSFQATKELLSRILDVDVEGVDEILGELIDVGFPLLSHKAEDDRLYYWIDKPSGI